MADVGNPADAEKSPKLSLLAGFLIAGSCFFLLFVAMARIIPLFLRFIGSPLARLLPAVAAVFVSVSGLIVYRKRRAKKAP
jgi:hypothetical protein